MTSAIVLRRHGGPDALVPEEIEVGEPGAGELLIRQTAIGVNFHDVYVRSGLYQTLTLPGIPGIEAVGTVARLGPGVDGFRVGQRVGYVTRAYGGYAGARVLPAAEAIALPDGLSDVVAASLLLKGLTACMLLRRVHVVKPGDAILVHAAAGGVGQLLCRWGRHLGATVIGTAGSPEKAEIARRAGASEVLAYREGGFARDVMKLTGGRGVDVVYDAVGRDTFAESLESLAFLGALVNYGQASGPVDPIAPAALGGRSNSLSRPVVFHYLRDRPSLEAMACEVFAAIADGVLVAEIGLQLPLARAAEAHAALEARATTGAVVLVP